MRGLNTHKVNRAISLNYKLMTTKLLEDASKTYVVEFVITLSEIIFLFFHFPSLFPL